MGRRKITEYKSDEQLEQEGKNKEYNRQQQLLDIRNTVAYYAIIIVPCLALLYIVIITTHYIVTNDWKSITDLGEKGVVLVAGYLARYLQEKGIKTLHE